MKLVEVLDDPKVDSLFIIMEFVKNGTLSDKINKGDLSAKDASRYMRDLLQGLFYLHEVAGIVHRDIKPDNLLIDENDVLKISDFGVSTIMENGCDELTSTAGSNYFLAPEATKGASFKGRCSDVWAVGVTLYYLIFKKFPFTSNNIPDLY